MKNVVGNRASDVVGFNTPEPIPGGLISYRYFVFLFILVVISLLYSYYMWSNMSDYEREWLNEFFQQSDTPITNVLLITVTIGIMILIVLAVVRIGI